MIRKLKYILPAVILITSCSKQLNINTDPNNPTILASSQLLTGAEYGLGTSLAMGEGSGGLSQVLGVYMHQLTVREDPDQYLAPGSDFNIESAWNGLYINTINNLDVIIANGTAAGDYRNVGIAEVLKAYAFSQLVDTFGDVPYFEANELVSKIKSPHFDNGSAIYPSLLSLLDQGIADLNKAPSTSANEPGDVIYKGLTANWVKAANSIKLKLYVQERKVVNVSTQVNALLANPSTLIAQTSESFLLPFGPLGATDNRNPAFTEYFTGQKTDYMSPWFYEIMKGYNITVNNGIADPRVPYYFYNQLKPTQSANNPTEYRDGAFVSIYFGSLGPNQGNSQQTAVSTFGIYPVGGKYDDGSAGATSASSGTGAAPYRFITYADILYLKAELINVGIVSGDARATFQSAMQESFKQVDYCIGLAGQTAPAIYNSTAMTTYINAVLAQYDANGLGNSYVTSNPGGLTGSFKLQSIITQKWISAFGSAVDAYSDYRRTGFPILFDPKNTVMAPGGLVQPPINGDPANPGAQKAVPVTVAKNYPLTLPWYTGELELNQNAPLQKLDPSTYKPFWMP